MLSLEDTSMSLKNLLSNEPFSYRAAKSGLVHISYNGKIVTTLSGPNSSRFLANVDCADSESAQLTMAKVTGNFKHGSERVSRNHIRNS